MAKKLPQPPLDYLRNHIRSAVYGPHSEEMLQLLWANDLLLPSGAIHAQIAIADGLLQARLLQPELFKEQKELFEKAWRNFYWDIGRKEAEAEYRRTGIITANGKGLAPKKKAVSRA